MAMSTTAPRPTAATVARRRGLAAGLHSASLLLFCLCFAAPGGLIGLGALQGTLPPPLDESGEFLPASFQWIWFIPLAVSVLRWRPGRQHAPLMRAAGLTLLAGVASWLMGGSERSMPNEAWMPLVSGAIAVLAFALMPEEEARHHLRLVMLANAWTIPAVLVLRLASGSDFLRLNALGLNANSSGLIFAMWWMLLQSRLALPVDLGRSRLASLLALLAVLVSGSRTAYLIVLAALASDPRWRRINWQTVAVAVIGAAVLVVALSRSTGGEDHGEYAPPDEVATTSLESVSAVGRAWSLLVGVQVLSETTWSGTQSVEGAVQMIRDHGYPTFSHSTALMLLILYGAIGAVLVPVLVWRMVRVDAPALVRAVMVTMFLISGGLVTNPKEVALCIVLLVLWPDARGRRAPPTGPAK